jgi:hypothetical protein
MRYFNLNIKALATKKAARDGRERRMPRAESGTQKILFSPFHIDRAAFIFPGLSLPALSAKFWNVQAFRTVFESVARRLKQIPFHPTPF